MRCALVGRRALVRRGLVGAELAAAGGLPATVRAELPIWLATTRDERTFREAGELGAGVLTAMLRLSHSELAERIRVYREARTAAGHPGRGHVTVMLHGLVAADGADAVEAARAPLRAYLRAHLEHTRELIQQKSGEPGHISRLDEDEVVDLAVARYVESAASSGTLPSQLGASMPSDRSGSMRSPCWSTTGPRPTRCCERSRSSASS